MPRQVVLLLVENGHITLKEAYLDGTKSEAGLLAHRFLTG
jgi:hypothetical protein